MPTEGTPPPSSSVEDVELFVNEHLLEYHAYVGRIASVWAMLEFRIDQLLWLMVGVDQTYGACLTSQMMGTTPRLRSLRALMELRGSSPELIKEIKSLTGSIIVPQEDRNRAVHDPWFIGGTTKTASQIRKAIIEDKVVYGKITRSLNDLEKIYKKAVSKLIEFNEIRDKIIAEQPSSLKERQRKRRWRAPIGLDNQK
ncbi:MAG: hypothetical protein WCC64_19685 [Aliidongia sp.]